LAVVALVLAQGVAACGDDAAGTLSAAEYRNAGNAICGDADAAVSAALPEEEPTIEVAQTELAPQLSEALSDIRNALNNLSPPSNLADGHAQLLSALDSATETLDQATKDRAVVEQLLAEGPPLNEIGEHAAQLGLTACTGGG
jgi:hypothetical protein